MKREDVKAHFPDITQEQLDWIMAENGRDVQAVTAQRDGLQAMLDTANQKLEGYDPEWKTKSETAAQQAQAKVEALERGYAAERAVSGLKFSSESAKRAFLADLAEKKLPLQNGKLLGFDDHLKQYKETDPGAFAAEGGVPRIVADTSSSQAKLTGNEAANAAFRAAFGKE